MLLEHFGGSAPVEALAGPVVDRESDGFEILGDDRWHGAGSRDSSAWQAGVEVSHDPNEIGEVAIIEHVTEDVLQEHVVAATVFLTTTRPCRVITA